MTKAIESVLADALRLDTKARAELAAELLASLDGPADPDAGIAWDREIKHRVDALEAGTEKLESWESVKRRIARDILGQTRALRNLKAAGEEFDAAVRWYEGQPRGLGGKFFDAIPLDHLQYKAG